MKKNDDFLAPKNERSISKIRALANIRLLSILTACVVFVYGFYEFWMWQPSMEGNGTQVQPLAVPAKEGLIKPEPTGYIDFKVSPAMGMQLKNIKVVIVDTPEAWKIVPIRHYRNKTWRDEAILIPKPQKAAQFPIGPFFRLTGDQSLFTSKAQKNALFLYLPQAGWVKATSDAISFVPEETAKGTLHQTTEN